MFFGDLQLGLYVAYAVLLVWRGSVGIPEGYVPYLLSYFLLVRLANLIERVTERRVFWRNIQVLNSLDPAEVDVIIARTWSALGRRTLREAIDREGRVERTDGEERYALPRSARQGVEIAFWCCALAALAAFVVLLGLRWPGVAGWSLWMIGFILSGIAGILRRRAQALSSIVIASPWELRHESAAGARISRLRWAEQLRLTNDPRRGCYAIESVSTASQIVVDYRTIGCWRLFALILDRGGFKAPDVVETSKVAVRLDVTDDASVPPG